jgi:uncharacterized protein YbbK (DUF523 family)
MANDPDVLPSMEEHASAFSQKILVSACLLGQPVRYDGGHKLRDDKLLRQWMAEGRVVPICPELAGGLVVPRLPAEISNASGLQVLSGGARVMESGGRDVSAAFVSGAQQALRLVRMHGIRLAVLKEGSPSCGTGATYDGSFSGKMVAQSGVTAALLRQAGVLVFNQ